MSFEAMAWAVKQDLPVKQKITLLMIANRINSDTGRCFPSIKGLARDCGMSETSVKEAIRSLRDAGILVAYERRIEGVSLSNEYELPMGEIPTPPACDAPPPGVIRPTPRRVTPPNLEDNLSLEPSLFGSIEPHSDAREAKDVKTDRFDEFWAVYPAKVKKPVAFKAWQKAVRKTDPDKIIAAARIYAGTETVQRGFVQHPQGWLNAERFNDPDLQPAPTGASKPYRYVHGGIER